MANSRFGLRTRLGSIRNYSQGAAGGDADANLFLDAALITDATITAAIQQLVIDLKNYGIWNKCKAIYPFVGGSASSHKWNLKDARDLDAAYRLVFSGGWTHSSSGALPNGTNGYADTNLNDVSLVANNSHMSFYSRTNENIICYDMGIYDGSKGIWFRVRSSLNEFSGGIFQTGASGEVAASNNNSTGYYIAGKNGSTFVNLYKNGTLLTSQSKANTTATNTTIYLAVLNQNGTPSFGFSSKEISFATIGDGLTDTEAANLYTAVQAFQTTLGRQV